MKWNRDEIDDFITKVVSAYVIIVIATIVTGVDIFIKKWLWQE